MDKKLYYQMNRRRIIDYNKKRYKENKEECLEYQKKYREENKDYLKKYWITHKKEINAKARLKSLARRKKNFCKICGVEIPLAGGKRYCCSCKRIKNRQWVNESRKKHKKQRICYLCASTIQKGFFCQRCKVIHKQKIKNKEQKELHFVRELKKKLTNQYQTEEKKRWNCAYYKTKEGKIKKKKYKRLRRLRKRQVKEDFTENEWIALRDLTNGICPRCRLYVGVDNLTIDHIIPISKSPKGFVYSIEDIQPLCKSCNSIKGDKL